MNPRSCRLVLRPRSPLDTFDLTLRFVREEWRTLGPLVAWVVCPPALIGTIACWITDGHWALLALPFCWVPFAQAPFTVATGHLIFADALEKRAIARTIWELLPRLAAVWMLVALALGAAFALSCGILFPIVQVVLGFLPEAVLLERNPVSRAVNRSVRLSTIGTGTAWALPAASWTLTLWFALLGEMSGQFVFQTVLQLGQPFGAVVEGQVTPFLLFGLLAAQPLFAIYRLLLYVDVRTRVEGWDLQVALHGARMGMVR